MRSASRFAFLSVILLRQATGSRLFMGSKRVQNPHDYTEYIIPFLLYICQFEHICLNPLYRNASRLFFMSEKLLLPNGTLGTVLFVPFFVR